jgi:hypothetical protein
MIVELHKKCNFTKKVIFKMFSQSPRDKIKEAELIQELNKNYDQLSLIIERKMIIIKECLKFINDKQSHIEELLLQRKEEKLNKEFCQKVLSSSCLIPIDFNLEKETRKQIIIPKNFVLPICNVFFYLR